jgi:hypothetical protein
MEQNSRPSLTLSSMPSVHQFQQPAEQTTTPTALLPPTPVIITCNPSGQKISRDSMIHKNDVFQFDDVDSVHTHDSLFVPHSSLESNDLDENEHSSDDGEEQRVDQNNNNQQQNGKKKSSSKKSKADRSKKDSKNSGSRKSKLLANFISPLIRSNSTKIVNKPAKDSSVNGGNNDAANGEHGGTRMSLIPPDTVSLEKSSSFSRHLSSLKRLIVSKNADGRSASNLNVAINASDRPSSARFVLEEEIAPGHLTVDVNLNGPLVSNGGKTRKVENDFDLESRNDEATNGDEKKNGRKKKFLGNLTLTNGKGKDTKIESK